MLFLIQEHDHLITETVTAPLVHSAITHFLLASSTVLLPHLIYSLVFILFTCHCKKYFFSKDKGSRIKMKQSGQASISKVVYIPNERESVKSRLCACVYE